MALRRNVSALSHQLAIAITPCHSNAYESIDFPFPLPVIPAMSANPARALPAISPVSEPAAEAGAPHLAAPHGVIQEPPKATVRPVAHRNHADIRIDEYFWLRNREDPEVLGVSGAGEPVHRRRHAAHGGAAGAALYEEMRGRIKETDLSVPERLDDWLYYSRTEAGAQYPIHLPPADGRRVAGRGAPRPQSPRRGARAIFRLGAFEVSPDHRLLA